MPTAAARIAEDILPDTYLYTADWFSQFAPIWSKLLARHAPARLLEIGSYEGRAACFMIEQVASERPMELYCIDTWEGGAEHSAGKMPDVETRFDANIATARAAAPHPVDFHKDKALSSTALAQLLAKGARDHFDLIYVDGSHQAPDVLADAVLSFMLLRPGGLLIFDDYLWSMPHRPIKDFYQLPKPAIDAFVNIYQRKLRVIRAPLYQLYLQKLDPSRT